MDKALLQATSELVAELLADAQKDWAKEVEIISAAGRAIIAELKAQNAELAAMFKEMAGAQVARVGEAIAGIQHGKDADPAEVERLVAAHVERAFAAAPKPKNGDSVTVEQLVPSIEEAVTKHLAGLPQVVAAAVDEAVTKLPPAEPGKDADPVETKRIVDEAVERAVKALPTPKDGDSVTLEDVMPTISEAVRRGLDEALSGLDEKIAKAADAEVKKLPPAKNGESVTLEDVAPVIAEAARMGLDEALANLGERIAAAAAAEVEKLPEPQPGKSVTVEELAPVVADAVSLGLADLDERINARAAELIDLIPRPKDGDSVTIDQVRPVLEELVKALPPAQPGKDADMDQIRSMLEEMVGAIPKPRDGEPGTSVKAEDVVPVIAEAMKAHLPELVSAAVTEAVEALPPAEPGKSITVDDVAPMIIEEIGKAVGALPPPKDGDPGKDVDMDQVRATLDILVKEAVTALPIPKDGEPGTSVTLDDVAPIIQREIAARVEALPKPKDGEPGMMPDAETIRAAVAPLVDEAVKALPPAQPGKDADMQVVEEMVRRAVGEIPRPKDGVSVTLDQVMPAIAEQIAAAVKGIPVMADSLIDREGNLVITWTNGEAKRVGPVVGRDADQNALVEFCRGEIAKIPVPKDGVDGLGFDDMAVEYDGDRSFVLRWARGEIEKSCKIEMPIVLDRGVFKDGSTYGRGDGVTWGGSFWIAQEDTTDRPGEASKAWRLAVKKGRDGREVVKLPRDPKAPVKLKPDENNGPDESGEK